MIDLYESNVTLIIICYLNNLWKKSTPYCDLVDLTCMPKVGVEYVLVFLLWCNWKCVEFHCEWALLLLANSFVKEKTSFI